MTAFLIISETAAKEKRVSEWIFRFHEVQEYMNSLEKRGRVSNVKVQKFVKNKLVRELTYDFNGVRWERRI
jgi:hypothetical protein